MNLFTLIFPDRQGSGRIGRCRLPWVSGQPVRRYLHAPVLRELGLIGLSQRCKLYNSQKTLVKLYYVPPPNDFVVLIPVRAS